MGYRIAADLAVVAHLAFILFVFLGGLLVLRWPRAAWAHIPAAAWGVLVEVGGFYCPLTPLENRLRQAGGEAGYDGGFVEHYLLPVLYPDGLTREIQLLLGLAVLLANLAVYGVILHRWLGWRAGGAPESIGKE
jgi:hypothetical protein